MFNIELINFSLSLNSLYLILGSLIFLGYAYYSYRITIPIVSAGIRRLLLSLRAFALIIILLLIFEPILSLTIKETLKPSILVFFDNTKSITKSDKTDKKEIMFNFINTLQNTPIKSYLQAYSFGENVKKLDHLHYNELTFEDSPTNFENIFTLKMEDKNPAAIVIVSDGAITEGSEPFSKAVKINAPIRTLGVGDLKVFSDVELRSVVNNDFVYINSSSIITASITNSGFENKSITASLYENNKLIEKKSMILSSTGTQTLVFNYFASIPGEHKFSLKLDILPGESNYLNNSKTFYIRVIDDRVNIALVSGAPSPDYSFIKNSLMKSETVRIFEIVQLSKDRFLNSPNIKNAIDSADIFFLIGFPTEHSSLSLVHSIFDKIKNRNTPFFIVLSPDFYYSNISSFEESLPFAFSNLTAGIEEVQPNINPAESKNPLLQMGSINLTEEWNNLPPVKRMRGNYELKQGAHAISGIKIKNIAINSPLIIASKQGNKRSVAITAFDIWRWKFYSAERENELFNIFILNCIKWLNAREDIKLLTIRTSQKVYSLGQKIRFYAQALSETYAPIENGEVKIKITSGEKELSTSLTSIGGGLYEGEISIIHSGEYYYSGESIADGKSIAGASGKFFIENAEVELLNYNLNVDFLAQLAAHTNGGGYYENDFEKLLVDIENDLNNKSSERLRSLEYNLFYETPFLIFLTLVFSLEWFIRKRTGML